MENVIYHHVGAVLCYTFGNHGVNINNYDIKDNDTIVFCFGEIDCRCHIKKHISPENTYKDIINTIADRYLAKIQEIMSNVSNVRVCVYNIVPPVQKSTVEENPDYPYIGTDEERRDYVCYFNNYLKEKCNEYNYLFIDLYGKYACENGYLNKEFSDGNVHISNEVFIKEFIDIHGLC